MRAPLRTLALSASLALGACPPATSNAPDAALSDTSSGSETGTRGPARVALDADPNGLWWDPGSSTLFIADDTNNRILAWRDGQSATTVVAVLPPATTSSPGLGQVVRRADGTLVVTRFGDGTAGDVAYISSSGTAGRISGLDATRRRIGLTVASDGTMYDGWFLRQASGRVGTVSTLTLEGAEAPLLTGLGKPVGVLAVGARLFVSDQDRNEVLVADRANAMGTLRRYAMVTGPDLLCEGPDGSLFAGSTSGVVYRIDSAGNPTTFDTGYRSTRGVAYDAVNRRLFVADHDNDPADGTTHELRIVPVDR